MLTLERRRRLKISTLACALAAGTPYIGSAQAAASPDAESSERQLVTEIAAAQAAKGPYSIDQLDPLSDLAGLYAASGDRSLELATLEQALQIMRANNGLYALEQAPLLKRSIRADEAAGDSQAAWRVEQNLLELAKRHRDDLRAVDIFREVGDRRMNVLRRYVGGEFPPEIVLGCYYSGDLDNTVFGSAIYGSSSCTAGSRSVVIASILRDAWRNYFAAIHVLTEHGQYSSAELHQIEQDIVRSSYDYHVYDVGRDSYRRQIAYNAANEAPWLDKITRAIELADWNLLFGQYTAALEMYQETYALLEQKAVPREEIDRLFSPELPVVLPVFEPNPLVSAGSADGGGYLDVTFDVDQLGSPRRVRITPSGNATRADKERLQHLIVSSRFRPRIVDGNIERRAPVALRYYLGTTAH